MYRLAYRDDIVGVQNGPSARRKEGAYLNRYVTERATQPPAHFQRNLWAAASWVFRVARPARINSDLGASLDVLKKSQLTWRCHHYVRDGTLPGDTYTILLSDEADSR
ncbi:MAG: hypothetical protein JO334_11165 [Verrucomicrobia bacterium]|nr:hypothetical protein [Verrucomicrobiota bacterium]